MIKKNNSSSNSKGIISQRSGLQSMGEPLCFAVGLKHDKKLKTFQMKIIMSDFSLI